MKMVCQRNQKYNAILRILSIENSFVFLLSKGDLRYKNDEYQSDVLGQITENKMASKMAAKSVCHSETICNAFILFVSCSKFVIHCGKLVNLH